MNSWKIILAAVVIFGAGVITGGLLVNHVNYTRPGFHRPFPGGEARPAAGNHESHPPDVPPPRTADRLGRQLIQQLNDQLRLAPEQRGKIEKIIAAGQEQSRGVWTNVNQQIRAELTPEQQKQFEALMKQRRSHHPAAPAVPTNAPPAV
jgi:hypothetical protein